MNFNDYENRCDLRVSSVMLSRGSSVFRAMFTGERFAEGIALNSTGTREVRLPEDKGDHMKALLRIIHLQHDLVPERIDKDEICEIARLADKYDMCSAIKPMAELWLKDLMVRATGGYRMLLLAAAYHFQHAKMFEELGSAIVLKNVEMSCAMVKGGSPLETDVFALIIGNSRPSRISASNSLTQPGALQEERTKALRALMSHLDSAVAHEASWHRRFASRSCKNTCTYAAGRLQLLMDGLLGKQVWPISEAEWRSLDSIMEDMRSVGLDIGDVAVLQSCSASCISTAARPHHISPAAGSNIKLKVLEVQQSLERPCFQCARAGTLFKRKCEHLKVSSRCDAIEEEGDWE